MSSQGTRLEHKEELGHRGSHSHVKELDLSPGLSLIIFFNYHLGNGLQAGAQEVCLEIGRSPVSRAHSCSDKKDELVGRKAKMA